MSKNTGRNDPCPCGSQRKFKHCCGSNNKQGGLVPTNEIQTLMKREQWDAAATLCQNQLQSNPDDLTLLHALASIELKRARYDQAIELETRCLSLNPKDFHAHYNIGILYQRLNKPRQAIEHYQQAIAIKPDYADAYCNMGATLMELGQVNEGLAAARKAVALEPDAAIFRFNLGFALGKLRRLDESIECYRAAIKLDPSNSSFYNNLGEALSNKGEWALAEQEIRSAISLNSRNADAYNNLGNTLHLLGRSDEACEAFETALGLDPKMPGVQANLASMFLQLGRLGEAIAGMRANRDNHPAELPAYSNLFYAMVFDPTVNTEAWRAEQALLWKNIEQALQKHRKPHRNPPDPERKLRIAYISPDFRNHAVARFAEPFLERHDKQQFEIFCYYNSTDHDQYTRRIRSMSDGWVETSGLNDIQLAECIRIQKIDILIDLAGHTANHRLQAMAMKPCPIQATFIGYPGSTWLKAIDYRITDQLADPPGSEAYYSETLLRLTQSLWCYRPNPDAPEVNASPIEHNGYLTLGSMNNVNKIEDSSLTLWAKLLHALPDARLVMATIPEGRPRQVILDAFATKGIGAQRIRFFGKLSTPDFLKVFHEIDIALDPLTVNGATTTCEALWMGVPTLSLVGNRFLSRAGLSILDSAGLREFACDSDTAAIALVERYARNPAALADLRQTLRQRLAQSALMDEVGYTRKLEALYREIWRSWCAAQASGQS
ncbi:tetratricopeptide repeat protein [Chitinimonas sp.]|uniref:O-linked N-acetylglucosamine transferase family protein n=1 Tax=Chitinimonas sp. TaxID=1934313 RepID=UPI0035B4C32C